MQYTLIQQMNRTLQRLQDDVAGIREEMVAIKSQFEEMQRERFSLKALNLEVIPFHYSACIAY